ncbi:hypothetical protein [Tahibacter sp.]|uniref:hypothetical protein n=1 Tax=Tahibacter sp. TaxID=2056211 RepID=UPI0028C3AD91|nr:hypothetical protein [Tahibacter sp.]
MDDSPRPRLAPGLPLAERTAQRLSHLRLAPLRSLRALADPHRAAQRTVRLISAMLGGAPVRCTVTASGYRVERGQIDGAVAASLPLQVVPLQWEQHCFGSVELWSEPARWEQARSIVAGLVDSLALLLAVHGPAPSAHALRGIVLTPERLHDLNNVANAITLQVGVIQAMLQRGRSADAAQFAERCVAQSQRLIALLVSLRTD